MKGKFYIKPTLVLGGGLGDVPEDPVIVDPGGPTHQGGTDIPGLGGEGGSKYADNTLTAESVQESFTEEFVTENPLMEVTPQ